MRQGTGVRGVYIAWWPGQQRRKRDYAVTVVDKERTYRVYGENARESCPGYLDETHCLKIYEKKGKTTYLMIRERYHGVGSACDVITSGVRNVLTRCLLDAQY
jgi:hypothetical protein